MMPVDYFGFVCHPQIRNSYMIIVSTLGLNATEFVKVEASKSDNLQASISACACGTVTLKPNFRGPGSKAFHSATFALLGLSAFIPVIHGIFLNGWVSHNRRMSITHFIGLALLNEVGALFYSARIPEKLYPRKFDIFGCSHQIMHMLVMCGALSEAAGLTKAFIFWQTENKDG